MAEIGGGYRSWVSTAGGFWWVLAGHHPLASEVYLAAKPGWAHRNLI
jgi:hypothetical protein